MQLPLTIGVMFTCITDTLATSKTSPHSHTKSHVHFYNFLSIYILFQNFLDLKFFPLILVQNTTFFPDFPDWKKLSKFSLIGGNPVIPSKELTRGRCNMLFV